jgi:hypothetical protein
MRPRQKFAATFGAWHDFVAGYSCNPLKIAGGRIGVRSAKYLA